MIQILNIYNGELTISQLCNEMLLAKGTVSGIVSRLEKNGFIEKFKKNGDQRNTYIRFSSKGEDFAKTLKIKYNIVLTLYLKTVLYDFFELSDICNVFSNMIDYLIEKCEDMKGKNLPKTIKLSGKEINNFYIIKCECSKTLEVINKNSTKESNILVSEELLNDLIINSIKKSVDKYSGELVIETINENYSITILLPLTNRKVQE
jgi:DNA-binding MarR family transcriptional regulator